MSISAISSFQPTGLPGSLVPTLPSENAVTAASDSSSTASSSSTKHLSMFADGDDSPSFWDFVDIINPLQHIPLINDLYQEATGDKIGVGARLVGGALFGGPIGLIGAAANCIFEESTGHDAGGHLLALFKDDPEAGDGTALAAATVPNPVAKAEADAGSAAPAPLLADASTAKPFAPDGGAKPLILNDLVGAETLANSTPPPPAAAPRPPVQASSTFDPALNAEAQAVAAKANAGAAGRPMALGREARFMPVPGRNTPLATQSPPAVGTTVSTTGSRSNAPITGARPNTASVSPAMVQQMAAAQGGAPTPSQAGATGDWFSASMAQAMDKYERGAKLNRGASSAVADPQ